MLNSLLKWLMKNRIPRIHHFMKNPIEVQQDCLKMLTEVASDTEYGKKYGFGSVNNANDFRNNAPIHTYESIKPYIDRLLKGEQDLLWPSKIKWFAKSAGTTADKSKFIPVSNESLEECHFKGGKDVIALYADKYPETEAFSGKNLTIGGSSEINKLNGESYYGDLSAVMIENLPFWADYLRTPERKLALDPNFERKMNKIAKESIDIDVRIISGVPTWNIVLIKKVFKLTGKNNLLDIWPNLELYVHGAVSFEPYRKQFKKFIPSDKMHYMETYNASEGFIGIQDQRESTEMLLMLDYGIYYEFIPIEEIRSEHPNAIGLENVELKKNYAVVISTNAGLWRYRIGDTIKFTSLSPFRIQITGRTKHFINAFGEEVIIENAIAALKESCNQTEAIIKDYTAGPIYLTDKAKGGHEWLIEFEKEPNDMNQFISILDATLQKVNTDYQAKRYKDMALQLPTIQSVKPGTFYTWMKKRGKLGGQNKVPRLSNDRKYIDDILKFIN